MKYVPFDEPLKELSENSQEEFNNNVNKASEKIIDEFFSIKKENDEDALLKNFVIGVVGKWGIGKTSFINALLGDLEIKLKEKNKWYESFNKKDNVIHLNPWKFGSKGDLHEYFISQISQNVTKKDNKKLTLKELESFNKYISLFSGSKKITSLFTLFFLITRTNLNKIIPTVIMGGVVYFYLMYDLFKPTETIKAWQSIQMFKDISFMGIFLLGFIAVCYFYRKAYDFYKVVNDEEIKDELNEILEKGEKRYICVIDDIDRLSDSQIYQVFTSVKEIIDFPNILFILAYDESKVHDAFEKNRIHLTENGEIAVNSIERAIYGSKKSPEFIEKIVHHTIPVKSSSYLYIKDELDKVYSDEKYKHILDLKKEKDYKKIEELYQYQGLTIREVKKFLPETINSLINKGKRIDLDIPCFVAINTLKFSSPYTYDSIKNSGNYDKKSGGLQGYIASIEEGYKDKKYFKEHYMNNNSQMNFGLLDFIESAKIISQNELYLQNSQNMFDKIDNKSLQEFMKNSSGDTFYGEAFKKLLTKTEQLRLNLYFRNLTEDRVIGKSQAITRPTPDGRVNIILESDNIDRYIRNFHDFSVMTSKITSDNIDILGGNIRALLTLEGSSNNYIEEYLMAFKDDIQRILTSFEEYVGSHDLFDLENLKKVCVVSMLIHDFNNRHQSIFNNKDYFEIIRLKLGKTVRNNYDLYIIFSLYEYMVNVGSQEPFRVAESLDLELPRDRKEESLNFGERMIEYDEYLKSQNISLEEHFSADFCERYKAVLDDYKYEEPRLL